MGETDTVLTPDQLAHFVERGYVVVPAVVPPGVIAAARERAAAYAQDPVPGPRHAFPTFAEAPELAALWLAAAPVLAGLLDAVEPVGCQLAMTFPPFARGAGRPHVDGTAGEVGGRPGTFSLLAGFPLTGGSGGRLWVWPGSHVEHAAHFAEHGPEAFWAGDPGFPTGPSGAPVATATPVQVEAGPGDLVLAHYLLGHCPGGVETQPRTTVYVRVTARDHDAHWREAMTDPWRDYSV